MVSQPGGAIDRVTVYPRGVIEVALRRGAFGVVPARNHPNVATAPSEQVRLLTGAIVFAAEIVSVRVIDHLVVSADEAFSFREASLL